MNNKAESEWKMENNGLKAISFLGYNPRGYTKTTYLNPFGGENLETEFFQEALVAFYQPQTLYVLLTPKAEQTPLEGRAESMWGLLQQRLNSKVELRPITGVPEGGSQTEIWQLFGKLTECLQERDQVLFDITNGFRSLPVLALIAVAYLRVACEVTIKGLIYGAFDAKTEEQRERNETPVFDLMPIVGLLDWTTATDQFIKTGNAQSLAGLLLSTSTTTQPLADNISQIAQALHLSRPLDVMKCAADLPQLIKAESARMVEQAPPFAALLERIKTDYGRFGVENLNDDRKRLIKHLELAEWYAAKGQTVHALSLAREWLPSLLCYSFRQDALNRNCREAMERLLSGSATAEFGRQIFSWNQIPRGDELKLRSLWVPLANVRNDVAHSGFTRNARPGSEVVAETARLLGQLRQVAIGFNLIK